MTITYTDGDPHVYQLTLKSLLKKPLTTSPEREIVYGDRVHMNYTQLNQRIHRLAGTLSQLGVNPGDTVAVLDYDSHRYLESFFAVPMMGAVLQTVNWRLSPDQIVYTVNHAGAGAMLVHADFLPLVETVWDRLETIQTIEVDLSGWKIAIGGARLPKGLAKAARDMGIEIQAGYGMSESCPLITLATPREDRPWPDGDPLLDTIIKAGKPVPLVDVEVMDPDGNILPHDGKATGEVVMRAPWLTAGYFKAPDKSKELWQDGWMHTGDVGYMDEGHYLMITDRIKDVIKSGGEWISSLDLENILSSHEAVLESAAIGIPDEKWGERPMMFVTLRPEFEDRMTAGNTNIHNIIFMPGLYPVRRPHCSWPCRNQCPGYSWP